MSEEAAADATTGLEAYRQATEDARILRREAQRQYEEEMARITQDMTPYQLDKLRKEQAQELREEMTVALFESQNRPFEDTTAESRKKGMTTAQLVASVERQARQNEARRRERSVRASQQP